MLEIFKQTIKENKLVSKGDKLVVGVSGGPDSVCLLYLLNEIKDEFNLELIVAHVNYATRGKDSDMDEELVITLAKKLNIDFKVLHTKRYKLDEKGNIEEKFRDIRYKFFDKIRKEEKANTIAVAHNQDDQVETMLMFFIRGSGLKGLSGMKFRSKKLIRPMLDISKKEIYKYLESNHIEYREDKSNADPRFTRNKIRHQLIPLIEKEYNPNISQTLSLNREVIRDDYDFIKESARVLFAAMVVEKNHDLVIDLDKFLELYKSLQRAIIRLAFSKYSKDLKNISVLDVNEVLRVMKEGREGAIRDIKGLRFQKKGGNIVISLYNQKDKLNNKFKEIYYEKTYQ